MRNNYPCRATVESRLRNRISVSRENVGGIYFQALQLPAAPQSAMIGTCGAYTLPAQCKSGWLSSIGTSGTPAIFGILKMLPQPILVQLRTGLEDFLSEKQNGTIFRYFNFKIFELVAASGLQPLSTAYKTGSFPNTRGRLRNCNCRQAAMETCQGKSCQLAKDAERHPFDSSKYVFVRLPT
jgi:hypothetical protein